MICLSSTAILMQSSNRKQKLIFPIAGADANTHNDAFRSHWIVCVDRTLLTGNTGIYLLISPQCQLLHWENVIEHCYTVSSCDSTLTLPALLKFPLNEGFSAGPTQIEHQRLCTKLCVSSHVCLLELLQSRQNDSGSRSKHNIGKA